MAARRREAGATGRLAVVGVWTARHDGEVEGIVDEWGMEEWFTEEWIIDTEYGLKR